MAKAILNGMGRCAWTARLRSNRWRLARHAYFAWPLCVDFATERVTSATSCSTWWAVWAGVYAICANWKKDLSILVPAATKMRKLVVRWFPWFPKATHRNASRLKITTKRIRNGFCSTAFHCGNDVWFGASIAYGCCGKDRKDTCSAHHACCKLFTRPSIEIQCFAMSKTKYRSTSYKV